MPTSTPPPSATRPASRRDLLPAVRFLQWSLGAVALLSTVAIGLGAFMVLSDASEHDDMFDGLGAFLGALVVVAGLALQLLSVALAWSAGRGARRWLGGGSAVPLVLTALTASVASGIVAAYVVVLGEDGSRLALLAVVPAAIAAAPAATAPAGLVVCALVARLSAQEGQDRKSATRSW